MAIQTRLRRGERRRGQWKGSLGWWWQWRRWWWRGQKGKANYQYERCERYGVEHEHERELQPSFSSDGTESRPTESKSGPEQPRRVVVHHSGELQRKHEYEREEEAPYHSCVHGVRQPKSVWCARPGPLRVLRGERRARTHLRECECRRACCFHRLLSSHPSFNFTLFTLLLLHPHIPHRTSTPARASPYVLTKRKSPCSPYEPR